MRKRHYGLFFVVSLVVIGTSCYFLNIANHMDSGDQKKVVLFFSVSTIIECCFVLILSLLGMRSPEKVNKFWPMNLFEEGKDKIPQFWDQDIHGIINIGDDYGEDYSSSEEFTP